MQDQTKERVKKFWKTDNYWLALLRDILVALLVVAVIISAVYLHSGTTTPLVAVQSESMEPHINKGDVVYLMATNIVTNKEGKASNYQRFEGYGDVIVYRPNGDSKATPIIHRAMDWVNAGDKLPNNQTAVHAGYITKGDHNGEYDQPLLFGGTPPIEPVKPEWIIGVAQYRVPWIGNLRLALPTVVNPLITVSDEYQRMPIFNSNSFPPSCLNSLLYGGDFAAGAKFVAKPF